jgi:hypothetical protein
MNKEQEYFDWLLRKQESLKLMIQGYQQELLEVNVKIQDNCKHSTLVVKSKYFEGSYDNISMTQTWEECCHCSAKLNLSTTVLGNKEKLWV